MINHFFSLKIQGSFPQSCRECPFSRYEKIELYCPVLGDISEWHQENDHAGDEYRHPQCKLEFSSNAIHPNEIED